MKKLGAGSILNSVAAVLGIVAVVATVICSTMTTTYAMASLTTCIVAGVAAIILCGAAIALSKNDLVSSAAVLGAIALYAVVLNNLIQERVLLIAGLFSYDRANTAGWSVFAATAVAIVALLVGCIVLMVGSFQKKTKE